MKGFRPSEDPEWRHNVHAPTGEVRQCAADGCEVTWPVTCHAGRRRYCSRCGAGRRRTLNRQNKRDNRFIAKWQEADRQELIWNMAADYADTGYLDAVTGCGNYSVRNWQVIVAEVVARGLEMAAAQMDGADDEDDANDEQADAEALASARKILEHAQAAIAHGDLKAAQIISEKITRLSARGSA